MLSFDKQQSIDEAKLIKDAMKESIVFKPKVEVPVMEMDSEESDNEATKFNADGFFADNND